MKVLKKKGRTKGPTTLKEAEQIDAETKGECLLHSLLPDEMLLLIF